MQDSELPGIRALPLFAGMEEETFQSLMRGAYVHTFPPRIELIAEGDPSDFLHIVLSGGVELFAAWNGRETTMDVARPVSTFILAASIRSAPYLMSARTLEKTRLVLLASGDVRAMFETDPAFARAAIDELALSYRTMVKSAKTLKLRTSLERLANYLARLHQSEDAAAFDLRFEKRRLASYLNMTPESLSRAFKTMRSHGVVVEGSRVMVRNPGALRALAKPNPLIDDPAS